MADRPREPETYKGKKKRRLNLLGIFAFIAAIMIVGAVVIFYSFQKYIVYEQDGISLQVPMLATPAPTDESGQSSFEQVDPEVVLEEPDYSTVRATAGEDLQDFKALLVPSEYIAAGEVDKYLDWMQRYGANALVLDMKPVSGELVWASQTATATAYGTSGTIALEPLVKELKEDKGYYLIAQINCCVDALFATRCADAALKTPFGGAFTNEDGAWLDPYNATVRTYISELAAELSDAGFDEVLLRTMSQPDPEAALYAYSADTSFIPTPLIGVSGLASRVTAAMEGRDAKLSVIAEAAYVRTNTCEKVGQDLSLLFKIFDRVACWAGTAWDHGVDETVVDSLVELGDIGKRFVPYMPYSPRDEDGINTWIVRIPDGIIG